MTSERHKAKDRRHRRIRKKIFGTAKRPRFCVTKSLNHMYVQLIDDENGKTLVGLSTKSAELRDKIKGGNREGSSALGHAIGERAKVQKISEVVFDRGGHIYHGRIKSLAEAAREAGLKF